MNQKIYLLIIFSVIFYNAYSQIGGKVYQFLELPNSARISALNGNSIVLQDDDINGAYLNPSFLNNKMNGFLTLNYIKFYDGINFGYASYVHSINNKNILSTGVHYVNYGKFIGADEFGNITNSFTSSEYALLFQYSRQIDTSFFAGITFKPILSYMEIYSSFGIAFDLGITYINHDNLFKAALVLRNAGYQIKKYYSQGTREILPFNIIAGFTKKFHHSPLSIYMTIDHLEKFDLTYKTDKQKEEETDPLTGELKEENRFDKAFDKVMRHISAGIELNISKNLLFTAGYNYRRRQEMKIDELPSTVGFSWGIGIRFNKFSVYYARSTYHLVGSPNLFNLTLNLNEISKLF